MRKREGNENKSWKKTHENFCHNFLNKRSVPRLKIKFNNAVGRGRGGGERGRARCRAEISLGGGSLQNKGDIPYTYFAGRTYTTCKWRWWCAERVVGGGGAGGCWLIDKFAIGCWSLWPQRLIRFYPAAAAASAVSLLLILPLCERNENQHRHRHTQPQEQHEQEEAGEDSRHRALHYFCENLLNMPNTQRCMQSGKPTRQPNDPPTHRPCPFSLCLCSSTPTPYESHPTRQTQPSRANQPWHCVQRTLARAAHICDINKLSPVGEDEEKALRMQDRSAGEQRWRQIWPSYIWNQ